MLWTKTGHRLPPVRGIERVICALRAESPTTTPVWRPYGVRMTMTVTSPVRLVLVDDHEMVIEGLKAMLAGFGNKVRVVGQAVGVERAVNVVDSLDPDVVLCDVRMQGSSGLDL